MQLYLAFGRSTTPIHGKGCAGRRIVRKSCNFISRSHIRPRQSMVRVARDAAKLQLYLAFGRSTTPIHGKGCESRRKVGKSCNFTSRSRVRPRQSMVGLRGTYKSCNFTSRSVARPRQSMVRIARHAEKLEKVTTLPGVRAFDHANPW